MEGTQKNKMAEAPMKKLLLKMGLPIIISMVLQALYNVIDSIYGLIDTAMVTLILTIVFEFFAKSLSSLFALSGGTSKEIIEVCTISLRIASIGYVFMGFSVAVQGVLQSLGYAIRPLIISLLRLVVFVFPVAYLFTLSDSVTSIVWKSPPNYMSILQK